MAIEPHDQTLASLKQAALSAAAPARQAALLELERWTLDSEVVQLAQERALQDEDRTVREAAVRLLGHCSPRTQVRRALEHCFFVEDDDGVRRAVVSALTRQLQGHPGIVDWLQSHMVNDPAVADAAFKELARIRGQDPEVYAWVKRCARQGEEMERLLAMDALIEHWKAEPETLQVFKDNAAGQSTEYVARTAMGHLVRGWPEDPTVLALLNQLAAAAADPSIALLVLNRKQDPAVLQTLERMVIEGSDYSVRSAALQLLAHHYHDAPATRSWIKDCVIDLDDLGTVAVQLMVRHWKDHVETFAWLVELATRAANASVREEAMQELLHGWADHPDTLQLAREALAHENWQLRCLAIRTLARDPASLSLLMERARLDETSEVRADTLHAIAAGWQDTPAALQLLTECLTDADSVVRIAAIGGLARCSAGDENLTQKLLLQVSTEPDTDARAQLVSELGAWFEGRAEAFAVVKRHAQEDAQPLVRIQATQAIGKDWKHVPAASQIIRAMVADPVARIRHAAIDVLASSWSRDPQTRPLMMECASGDPHPMVRRRAVRWLAHRRQDPEEVLLFLKARIDMDQDSGVRRTAENELARLERRLACVKLVPVTA